MKSSTITLKGVVYSQETGEAIGSSADLSAKKRSASQPAMSIHARTQRSKTLSRRYVNREPVSKAPVAQINKLPTAAVKTVPAPDNSPSQIQVRRVIKRSPQIRRFAPHPVDVTNSNHHSISDIAPTTHPVVQRAEAKRAEKTNAHKTIKPSDVIKREAIDSAMAKSTSQGHRRHRAPKRARKGLFSRLATYAAAGGALVLVAGYFTYLNMPNLSVRVAAAQAGIDASYPGYRPSGYSLNGPVAYNHGQVSMIFGANGGPDKFELVQAKSGWDSSAVLDNYVQPKAGSDYITSRDSGLTIYTFGDDAAWVSNGILYTIDGDAALSIEQVQRIATSM